MELTKVSNAIISNDKEIKPAEFVYNEMREIKVNARMVEMQIDRLTAELAKWQNIKNEMDKIPQNI